jgi:hypothetical protein
MAEASKPVTKKALTDSEKTDLVKSARTKEQLMAIVKEHLGDIKDAKGKTRTPEKMAEHVEALFNINLPIKNLKDNLLIRDFPENYSLRAKIIELYKIDNFIQYATKEGMTQEKRNSDLISIVAQDEGSLITAIYRIGNIKDGNKTVTPQELEGQLTVVFRDVATHFMDKSLIVNDLTNIYGIRDQAIWIKKKNAELNSE